ncbi:MAG: O-antigen ligase family protein [Lachnospiraceae bacterium]|jgi:hypothetical protein|nr:O-antigen ligase family protein [Lachnospiraceae bacterium]
MKIKTTWKRKAILYKFFLYGIIIILYHCFYLFAYPEIMNKIFSIYNTNTIIASVSFLCFLKRYRNGLKSDWLDIYSIMLIASISVECIYSLIIYPKQTIFITLRIALSFCVPILAVVYIKYFIWDHGTDKYIEFINAVSFAWNIYIILQKNYYLKTGSFLFDFLSYFNDGTVYMRNHTLRIGIGFMGECAILYNFAYLFHPKNTNVVSRMFHLFAGCVGFYCLIALSQSRGDIVYVSIGLAAIIMISGKRLRTLAAKLLVLAGSIYIVFYTNTVQRFLQTFQAVGEYTNSISNRVYAVAYYMECFKKNPILGNGLANTRIDSPYFFVEHGGLGKAYYGDVGFLGLMANLGIISFIVYVMPMVHMGRVVIRLMKRNQLKELAFPIGYYLYLLFSSISLLTVDRSRIIQMAFAIAYYEYLNINNKKKCMGAIYEKAADENFENYN